MNDVGGADLDSIAAGYKDAGFTGIGFANVNGIDCVLYDDEEDGFNIKWSSSPDPDDIFNGASTLVHLRRVHSEEGGTFVMFN